MSTNVNINRCPKCRAPLPADAPGGLCPKCVLAGAAIATDTGLPPTATSEIPSLERVAAAFPQLEILELIGRGGMGFVFKARQPHLDRFVALKLLPDKLARDPRFTERFNREGRVLARLNHPSIVSIFDFGQTEHFYFLLMEYVDGVNLRQAMRAGRFSPGEALAVVPKICEALQYAHEQGILHRDIKPENILLDTKGRVKIADFGIAKLVGDDKPDIALTATGVAIGTMHYMAPEQLEKPGEVDHRADIYSLGVVFYEMLTGELPIGRFAAPSSKTPVDSSVDDVVFRTLEKEPGKRFQSAGEVQTRVEGLAEAAAAAASATATAPPVIPPGQDFILCNPRLPRMAQLITAYAVLGAPALFMISAFTWLRSLDGQTHNFEMLVFEAAVKALEAITLIFLVAGGFKLRGLRPAGPGLLRGTFLSRIALLAVAIPVGIVLAARTRAEGAHPIGTFDIFEATIAWVAMGFEIAALVWLRKSRTSLDAICRQADANVGPHGTMVVNRAPAMAMRLWSKAALWGAVLVALSLPTPLLLAFGLYLRLGGVGGASGWEPALVAGIGFLPALAGTILGWVGASNIRESRGQLRGLPLALFAAFAWPVLVSVAITTWLVVAPVRNFGATMPVAGVLLMLVPAGMVTFTLWAVFATIRWAANLPPTQRRGVLKWVFLALLAFGAGLGFLHLPGRAERSAALTQPDTNQWIRFTFTAVELREAAGVRWLAIDYVDQVQGDCQKAFPWETTIPGFKAETRTSEVLLDDRDTPVRHQRVEYRLPVSVERAPLEKFRDDVARRLHQKTFRLELGEEKLLFEFPAPEGGSLRARVKVVPPLALREPTNSTEYQRVVARIEILLKREQELLVAFTPENALVQKVRAQIEDARETKKRLEQTP